MSATECDGRGTAPLEAWNPSPEQLDSANTTWLMRQVGVGSFDALHAWSVRNREAFWALAIERLGLRLRRPFDRVLDPDARGERPRWLPGARLNIAESCFSADSEAVAIYYQSESGALQRMTFGELDALSDRVAAGIVNRGFKPGDAIAVVLPMTPESVAAYLGVVKAGCVVVGVADSFRPPEIATRLRLAKAVGAFTQDVCLRGAKALPMYSCMAEAGAPLMIVLPAEGGLRVPLRSGDVAWDDFLPPAGARFEAVPSDPDGHVNILFSSGTTGEPKAIPWTQTTPIKCAADAHFHMEVKPGDVLVWPTSLGWMMGPWLVFAGLLNRASIGLYCGSPVGRGFGTFVQDCKATLLGVVPTLVKAWRVSGCLEGLDWSSLKVFGSTGECSTADDMRWLMQQAGWKPVVEYCGGTEIGGGYITGTLAKPCIPGTFNTPALGLDVTILDDAGRPADEGELFISPPSIGLSTELLNKDHHEVYFSGAPRGPAGEPLRRHGDRMERLPNGCWRALGRADDTMNLGGIKVSSAEIEQVLQRVPGVGEAAAVAVSPGGGPSLLVVFAVAAPPKTAAKAELLQALQNAIRTDLNPLFRIHDLVLLDALPRTASNKVLRRTLRDGYVA